MRIVFAIVLSIGGCRGFPIPELKPSPQPVDWRLVEHPSTAIDSLDLGDATLGEVPCLLVIEPLYELERAALPRNQGRRVVVRMSFSEESCPIGTLVAVELSLPEASPEEDHLMVLEPTRPGVHFIGPNRFLLRGGERITARFTSHCAGRGGIRVEAYSLATY